MCAVNSIDVTLNDKQRTTNRQGRKGTADMQWRRVLFVQ
jgi:hypothetical protein